MDRLAHGNMIKSFGEEMHWGGGGKIKEKKNMESFKYCDKELEF